MTFPGQRVVISPAARLRFNAIADPRFQEWELEDTELALLLGRETLPWTRHIGWWAQMRMLFSWIIRQERWARRSLAAKKGWITRRSRA